MVTKIVVRISSELKAASAEQSIHDIINDTDEICDAERGDYKIISTQLCDIQGTPNKAAAGGLICDEHSYNNNDVSFPCEPIDSNADDAKEEDSREQNNDNAGKKRPLLMGHSGNIIEKTKRRRSADKIIDLTDVPPQEPILRSIKSNVKGGTSRYKGVYLDKRNNKWQAQIKLDGKNRHIIGYYDNEEEAAVDYARAAFKYRSDMPKKSIDLTDVPPQAPVLRNIKGGTSKYKGVYLDKRNNKWQAQIKLDGKNHFIGYYDDEEEAAIDFARAAFKYRSDRPMKFVDTQALSRKSADEKVSFPMELANKDGRIGIYLPDERKARIAEFHAKRRTGHLPDERRARIARFHAKRRSGHRKRVRKGMDLTGVPPQLPILKRRSRGGPSKYQGVYRHESSNKWRAQICISGTQNVIGYYDDEEEAAVDYARAVFKYMASCEYKQVT